jgi:hypothetical protein
VLSTVTKFRRNKILLLFPRKGLKAAMRVKRQIGSTLPVTTTHVCEGRFSLEVNGCVRKEGDRQRPIYRWKKGSFHPLSYPSAPLCLPGDLTRLYRGITTDDT